MRCGVKKKGYQAMVDRNFKDFAVAYSIFKMISKEPIKTNVFAKTLNVGFHVAKRVISKMSKSNLVKAQRGFTSKGVEKIEGVTVKDIFALYNIDYRTDEAIVPQINEVLSLSSYRPRTCDICSCEISFRAQTDLCKECEDVTETPVITKLAKCGHPSLDRYFKCRVCLPMLPDEEIEDEPYMVHR